MYKFFSWIHSRRLRFLFFSALIFWLLFASLRIFFLLAFFGAGLAELSIQDLLQSLSLGVRFDLRVAIILLAIPTILLFNPKFNSLKNKFLRWVLRSYIAMSVLIVLVVYSFDFGHYQYLNARLNASVYRFLEDAHISAGMLWQSYPILKIFIGTILATVLFSWIFLKIEKNTLDQPQYAIPITSWMIAPFFLLSIIFFGIVGRVSDINILNPVPLRWSDAYESGNPQLAAIALNPITHLYETSRSRNDYYSISEVKNYYPIISDYLGVTHPSLNPEPNFTRLVSAGSSDFLQNQPPNIIFIMLESLGASRMGIFGNPLDPTPTLDEFAKNGLFLKHFYVPRASTAKSVWASLTGIPDATYGRSATRNPLIAHQRLALNALNNYTKIYTIGGNAGWANMKALIKSSITGVKLYEEQDWKSKNVDVWGISDLDLFKETNSIIESLPKDKPFFVYIQTAGNHEPFTIPKKNDGFVKLNPSENMLHKAGFPNEAMFNAVRLLDHSISKFVEMSKKSGYFDNTIFVFFGDHNNRVTTLPFMPPAFEQLGIEVLHVPGIIYAPKLIKPRIFDEAASLIDLIPTLLGILGVEYENTTLGRDINQRAPEGTRVVPTIMDGGNPYRVGAITRDFYIQMNADGSNASLHGILSNDPLRNVASDHLAEFNRLSKLALGLNETSRFLMFQNAIGWQSKKD